MVRRLTRFPAANDQPVWDNPVWFQHYRKENFQDDSLPPGKWTKRESKQNWVSLTLIFRPYCFLLSSLHLSSVRLISRHLPTASLPPPAISHHPAPQGVLDIKHLMNVIRSAGNKMTSRGRRRSRCGRCTKSSAAGRVRQKPSLPAVPPEIGAVLVMTMDGERLSRAHRNREPAVLEWTARGNNAAYQPLVCMSKLLLYAINHRLLPLVWILASFSL
jgi:hypothetical protein